MGPVRWRGGLAAVRAGRCARVRGGAAQPVGAHRTGRGQGHAQALLPGAPARPWLVEEDRPGAVRPGRRGEVLRGAGAQGARTRSGRFRRDGRHAGRDPGRGAAAAAHARGPAPLRRQGAGGAQRSRPDGAGVRRPGRHPRLALPAGRGPPRRPPPVPGGLRGGGGSAHRGDGAGEHPGRHLLPGADHTFSRRAWHEQTVAWTGDWLRSW